MSVVGSVLVGFAVVFGLRFFHNDRNSVGTEAGAGYDVENSAPRVHIQPSSRAGSASEDKSSRSGGSSESETGEEDPNAVIGRQFPVSTSIEDLCGKLSPKDEDRCALTHRKLEEFAQQPRNPVWASGMEEQLRDMVMSQPRYTIRNIECRNSLCIAEVASLNGMFHFASAIGADSPLHQNMMNGLEWQTAYERDPSNGTVTVTLMMFERHR